MAHVLERTNAKGAPFIGRCMNCGEEGLKISDIDKPCPQSKSDRENLIRAIEGDKQ